MLNHEKSKYKFTTEDTEDTEEKPESAYLCR